MYQANRFGTLAHMIDLRCLVGLRPALEGRERHIAALEMEREGCAEASILEIVEIAHVLRADGFEAPEILDRIGRVYGNAPSEVTDAVDPVKTYLTRLLRSQEPEYLDAGEGLFDAAYALAMLWGELNATQITSSAWPPPEMLSEPWRIEGGAGIIREVPAGGGWDAVVWPTFTRSLEDLDILLREYGGRGEASTAVRRMKARANPGDRLHGFSTPGLSWAILAGRSGIALVRDGRSIDFFETMWS
jgi:hypothetical protein